MRWLLDVEFKDDLSRYRSGHEAKNMAAVRRFALCLVRADKTKRSVKTKRKSSQGGTWLSFSKSCRSNEPLTWIPSRASDSGVMLLSLAERRRGIAKTLAALIADPRDPAHGTHTLEYMLEARIFAIACGLRQSEFASIRLHLLKIAGRIAETASRLCVALASCCPEVGLFELVAFRLQQSGP